MRKLLAKVGLAFALFCTVASPAVAVEGDRFPVLVICLWLASMSVLGTLVTVRVPGNVLGPIMSLIGFGGTLGIFSGAYSDFVFELGHEGWPLGLAAAWFSTWLTVPALGLFLLVFLRFPDGKLPSRGWKWVEVAAIVGLAAGAAAVAFRPGPVDNTPSVDNPLGIAGFEDLAEFSEGAGGGILAIVGLAAIASLVLRFRRARGVERRQLKSLALAAASFPFVFALTTLLGAIEPGEDDVISFVVVMLGLFLIPASLGVSILRYRLYDIDLVVNRALVYGSMTVFIALFYLGCVLALQLVLDPVTKDSDFAVAASTLAAAALVRPLRSRFQDFVDRRFYRRKYDSALTLTSLSQRLRDEVDLSVVGDDIVEVVKDTVQPAHVTLWLRSG